MTTAQPSGRAGAATADAAPGAPRGGAAGGRERVGPDLVVEELRALGVTALITTRAAGDLNLSSTEPVGAVHERWTRLRDRLGVLGPGGRCASSVQVHGTRLLMHEPGWEGWLRADAADGHLAIARGTALTVTVADCIPVFLAHPAGAVGMVHAGWRGTADGILPAAIDVLAAHGVRAGDLHVHLGPGICGRCYEVGPDVYARLTGVRTAAPRTVDMRGLLADQARAAGVRRIERSAWCTRCDSDLFFSHRGGDSGRQVAAIVAPASPGRPPSA